MDDSDGIVIPTVIVENLVYPGIGVSSVVGGMNHIVGIVFYYGIDDCLVGANVDRCRAELERLADCGSFCIGCKGLRGKEGAQVLPFSESQVADYLSCLGITKKDFDGMTIEHGMDFRKPFVNEGVDGTHATPCKGCRDAIGGDACKLLQLGLNLPHLRLNAGDNQIDPSLQLLFHGLIGFLLEDDYRLVREGAKPEIGDCEHHQEYG